MKKLIFILVVLLSLSFNTSCSKEQEDEIPYEMVKVESFTGRYVLVYISQYELNNENIPKYIDISSAKDGLGNGTGAMIVNNKATNYSSVIYNLIWRYSTLQPNTIIETWIDNVPPPGYRPLKYNKDSKTIKYANYTYQFQNKL